MKLVQLLAKELKEWPDNNLAEFAALFVAQDYDGVIVTLDPGENPDVAQRIGGVWSGASWTGGDLKFDVAEDHKTSIVTRDQWQAEREKMNKPKWIRHRGGKCPVADGVDVTYRLRGGYVGTVQSEGLMWDHQKDESDLMAYYIEEAKDQEIEEVKDTNIGTITYKLEIDATEATKEIDSLVAKWGQIESPLKWRDEIIELEAYEEEFRREREKLIRKLESEGFKMIDHMAPVYGEALVDMDNWENWENGDVIEVINESKSSNAKPGLYMITGFESSHPKIELGGRYFPEYANMKFIRRP